MVRLLKMPCVSSSVKLIGYSSLLAGGGGTGSNVTALHPVFERYMRSVQSSGKIIYIVSWPTAQENLNPTIARNALTLANDVAKLPAYHFR